MIEVISQSYDEVPYQSVALMETHPDRLSAIAHLFGLDSPRVNSCRILELGCAGGGNLIPLTVILPGSQFVGVDISPRQIEAAKATAESVGATNVEFLTRSLTEITPELGTFDYILCHGVYSWVPDEVKAAILRICRENLSPRGVAYVSYNTLPGWHVPGMVREMMLYHVRKMDDPPARARAARAFLDFLGTNIPDREGHYAKLLQEEAVMLRPHADSYLLHEHLEALNHPIYYHEFVDRAAQQEMKVFSDARVWSTAVASQPQIVGLLEKVAHDPVEREQYLDFFCNRRFRRSLLCHRDADVQAVPSLANLKTLRALAGVWPSTVPVDLSPRASIDFRGTDGMVRLSTIDPLFKAALVTLSEAFPNSFTFEELWVAVRHRLGRAGIEPGTDADLLAQRLLQAYGANALEFETYAFPFPAGPSERPEASAVARLVAETSAALPNLLHRQVSVSEFDRLVIRQLDGRRTHAEIVDRLVDAVVEGKFAMSDPSGPVRDPAVARPILERSLGPSLQRMLRNALLVR